MPADTFNESSGVSAQQGRDQEGPTHRGTGGLQQEDPPLHFAASMGHTVPANEDLPHSQPHMDQRLQRHLEGACSTSL